MVGQNGLVRTLPMDCIALGLWLVCACRRSLGKVGNQVLVSAFGPGPVSFRSNGQLSHVYSSVALLAVPQW